MVVRRRDKGLVPHVITYGALFRFVQCLGEGLQGSRDLELIQGMPDPGLVPKRHHFSALLSACAEGDKAAMALAPFQGMRDQGRVPKRPAHSAAKVGPQRIPAPQLSGEHWPATALQKLGLDGTQLRSCRKDIGKGRAVPDG